MKKVGLAVVGISFLGSALFAQPKGGSFPKIEKPSVNISKPNININSPAKAVFGSGSSSSNSSSNNYPRTNSSSSGNVNIMRSGRSQFGSTNNSTSSSSSSSSNSSSSAGYTPRTYTPRTYTPNTYTPRTYYPSTPSYYYNPYASPYGIYYRNNYYRTFYNSNNYYSRSNASTNSQEQLTSNRLHAQKVELTQDLSIRSWILKTGVWDTLARLKPVVQEFIISKAEEPFQIKTAAGITMNFPANSLTDAYGNPISGKVKFNVTELSKFSDFGTAGFSSSTTSGEMLESGND